MRDAPPRFNHDDIVRSRLDPSLGYTVVAHAYYRDFIAYVVRDPNGVEGIRMDGELELGPREKDPVTADT